jgi:hypothetical protein
MEVLRAYVIELGKEVCIKDPAKIAKILLDPDQDLDLDLKDSRGHVKMSSSRALAGKTVRVGDLEIQLPS